MLKIVLEVEGMRCGMCETHVNDVVRRVDGVKKVKSSHARSSKRRSQSRATAWEELKHSRMKNMGCFRARGECYVFSS